MEMWAKTSPMRIVGNGFEEHPEGLRATGARVDVA